MTRPAYWLPADVCRCQGVPRANDIYACPKRSQCKRHLALQTVLDHPWVPVNTRLCDTPEFEHRIPVED